MEVLVNVEHRFRRTPDGAVWTKTQFPYAFWRRYLEVFSSVRIVARAQPVASVPADWARVDGESVDFHALPYYQGLSGYLRQFMAVQRSITAALKPGQAVILRVHSPIAAWIERRLTRERRPYAVEVVADPWDLFSPGAMRHPLRPLLRQHFAATLRRQCKRACASAFVTEFALQQRYPGGPGRFTTHYSSIELSPEYFCSQARKFAPGQRFRIITVGALNQMYKGVDVLIDAVSRCRRSGGNVCLTVVGDGQQLESLKALASRLGLKQDDEVEFLGALPAGDAVRKRLDASDLFVLASRQEGLPRSMIEAMARGLPCIGTNVGGIPELLPAEDRVAANDACALAAMIGHVIANPDRMNLMATRNLRKASEYEEANLRFRRNQLYTAVRDATQQWLGGNRECRKGQLVESTSAEQVHPS